MREVTLTDKYTERGAVLMTGTQALVRLPMLQREADARRGWNTAGFISGYRGSPLGSYDMELWRAAKLLEQNDIVFQPGVNEDLAATAVWGTQMLDGIPGATKDGVFAIWYGKGPGVDRSGDPFKHGNTAGSHSKGGVLIVAGDDHSGKSSTVAHQSELALMHAGMPILAPSNVQDVLEMGLLGFAMSRYTGLFTGFKLCNEVLEQTMTVEIGDADITIVEPDRGEAPPTGFNNYPTHLDRVQSEIVAKRYRWPLVQKFVRANSIDKVIINAPKRRLGIISTGKAVQDVLQALRLIGLDDESAAALGISLYKLGCMYPVEEQGLAEFAADHDKIFIIEEKEGLVENQVKSILYGSGVTPVIVGKRDEVGSPLIPSDVQLEPAEIALQIADRLQPMGIEIEGAGNILGDLRSKIENLANMAPPSAARSPYFCSGCPHNTGTRFPDGSIAAGGIGCHAMAMYSGPDMLPNAQMGGEGAHWYSLHHFTDTKHMFQNMGDGTYYHSGILAVRGAVASGASMTFKILFNDAVAMTGGQAIDGPLSVGDISRQVLAEGVKKCVVVTDRPDLYGPESKLGPDVTVHHRDIYDTVQKDLLDVDGVTVIIYEQTCAAEKRRRRKRGKFPDPPKRMFINSAVCEGCGDCSEKSNCVSLWPKETELGRKRQIDQSSCNKDYSCVKGFCPSFVTILDAEPRKPEKSGLAMEEIGELPEPALASLSNGVCNIMVSGIGGTGVVTIGALLGMAAHIDGLNCSIFDMTGLSQKNGAVYSHVRIARHKDELGAQKLGVGEADVALAFDAVAALSKEPVMTLATDRTRTVANARVTPTPAFQRSPDLVLDTNLITGRLKKLSRDIYPVDASGLGLALLGDSIASNLFMLGYSSQLGLLPVSPASIERAVEINGVAIDFNKKAFALGRLQAVDPDRIERAVSATISEVEFEPLTDLDDIIAHRTELLTKYQNADYAKRFQALVGTVRNSEAGLNDGSLELSVMVARNFAKLMAYKDEYEVGRLYSDPAFKESISQAFEDGARLRYNLAPPLFSKRDPETGELLKREFGPWVGKLFPVLAAMRKLRGTRFDIFGYSAERKMERSLIDCYEDRMQQVADRLDEQNYKVAVELASLPGLIRGFGHVKEANVAKVRDLEAQILKRFDASTETTEIASEKAA
jgi:indolepyruvate ferredoxin oxidoreductase